MEREPNTEYILSLSYGKDSLACLRAIELLGWPLDRIIHAEVWATDDIPADLPPMVEFKVKADQIIKERWGIEVEHLCATRNGEKLTYEKLFYHVPKRKDGGKFSETSPAGFPYQKGAWCNNRLKTNTLDAVSRGGGGNHRFPLHDQQLMQETQRRVLSKASLYPSTVGIGVPDSKPINLSGWQRFGGGCGATGALKQNPFSQGSLAQGAKKNIVQYLGIAADEPERIARHTKPGFLLPLVEIGWEEDLCGLWCQYSDLLSPIYTTATRGGVLVLSQSRCRPTSASTEDLSRFVGQAPAMGLG